MNPLVYAVFISSDPLNLVVWTGLVVSNVLFHRKAAVEAACALAVVMWQIALLGTCIGFVDALASIGHEPPMRGLWIHVVWTCASYTPTIALTAALFYCAAGSLSKTFLLTYRVFLLSIAIVVIDLMQIFVGIALLMEAP